jgi:hypothetical protein
MTQNTSKAFAAATAILLTLGLTATATSETTRWFLPRCQADGLPVTLQIITEAQAGWRVNGVLAHHAEKNAGGWVDIPPSQWIGPPHPQFTQDPGTYTYVVHFSAPGPHGAMSVSATWAADNCGVSLQGGTGTPVSTGACYEGDKDFVASHTRLRISRQRIALHTFLQLPSLQRTKTSEPDLQGFLI